MSRLSEMYLTLYLKINICIPVFIILHIGGLAVENLEVSTPVFNNIQIYTSMQLKCSLSMAMHCCFLVSREIFFKKISWSDKKK